MQNPNMRKLTLTLALTLPVALLGCAAGGTGKNTLQAPQAWPISSEVHTTAERQVLPVPISPETPHVNPAQVALYSQYGYSAWQPGPGLPLVKRTELAPAYQGAAPAATLLTFFTISDIHLTDKESPAQPINPGWSAAYGPGSGELLQQSYSPVILSTTQVLDAAIQTVNVLHQKTPFDFGISLGDDINNTQYNELRWFIDVLDGQVITPSSGAHAGAETIDYQKPYQAAGLDKSIPWYQTIGNHDQYWSGVGYDVPKLQKAHVGDTVLNFKFSLRDAQAVEENDTYAGVVDGTTPLGNVIDAGPQQNFATPPKVVADANRHSLATSESTTKQWMAEFFKTSTLPVGHGFSPANVDEDFACYSFEPKSELPLKVIVLDDTNKKNEKLGSPYFYGTGHLDEKRLAWLKRELQQGQDQGKLMIIAAHIPIKPQADLHDATPTYDFYSKAEEDALLATLHTYPNLILWLAGHRHLNTVTPLPNNPANLQDHPERSFWEVETASLRDFPQQFRTFELRRNADNTISILTTNVDPAVAEGSPAAKSRGYAIGAARIFGATPAKIADPTSHAYNAELVKQLTPEMQAKIAKCGTALPAPK